MKNYGPVVGFKLGSQPHGAVYLPDWLEVGMIVFYRCGWREPGGGRIGRIFRRRVREGTSIKIERILHGRVLAYHYP